MEQKNPATGSQPREHPPDAVRSTDSIEPRRDAEESGRRTSAALTLPATAEKNSRRRKVPWQLINFWLDACLLALFLILVWVSTVIRFVFPAPTSAKGWSLWGMGLDHWQGIQFAVLACLAFAIVVHVMLHWSWVCGTFFSKVRPRRGNVRLPDDGTRTIFGVALMIAILNVMGLLIAWAAIAIQSPL